MLKIYFTFFIIFFSVIGFSQNIIGNWEGVLQIQKNEIPIVFHISSDTNGKFIATFDSPKQKAFNLACSDVIVTDDSVILMMQILKGRYSGKLNENNNQLTGTWFQGGGSLPLNVIKTSDKATIKEIKRPQIPKPPFNYNVDSVEYDNAGKTVHLAATLTYPKTMGPFTVAVMITGSGLQDRDETILNHKPFAVIADYLTKNGIAVLRVDDRNMGKSTGDVIHATSADFANDVITSIQYLLTRKEIDKNKIGVIGHSEGGFIAPMIYTKWPELSFIVSLAGTGVSGSEILLKQQTDGLKNQVSNEAFNAYYSLTKQTLQIIHDRSNKNDSVMLIKTKKVFNDLKASLPDSILKALNMKNTSAELYANAQVKPELKPWLKYFIATEPDEFWSKVKCPVLALNGEKDIQVYANQNIPAIMASLKKAGNKNVTAKIIPGLNHLFQHCKSCTVEEYGELEETFDTETLKIISNWIKETVH